MVFASDNFNEKIVFYNEGAVKISAICPDVDFSVFLIRVISKYIRESFIPQNSPQLLKPMRKLLL